MSIITIDVNIQQLSLLARQIDQIANEQNLASRSVKGKLKAEKTDLSFKFFPQQEVTLGYKRKKRDVSQTKKLY